MVDKDKGHIFHWKYADFEPVRGIVAILGALVLLFFFFQFCISQLSLRVKPFTERQSRNALINSSGESSLNYITFDQVTSIDEDADFNFQDPFHLMQNTVLRAERIASDEMVSYVKKSKVTKKPYEIQYLKIPYTSENKVIKPGLKPDFFQRRSLPEEFKPNSKKSLETQIQLSFTNGIERYYESDFSIPFKALGQAMNSISFAININKQGLISYAIPLDPAFNNEGVSSWIRSLKFTSPDKEIQGKLTLNQVYIEEE